MFRYHYDDSKKSMIMRVLLICFLSFILIGCYSYNTGVPPEMAQKETLLFYYSKIIWTGDICFLHYEDGVYKKIQYGYRIRLKEKSVSCTKKNEEVIDINSYKDERIVFYTSESFKNHIKESSLKYYKCFSDDFLDLSNDEKITLLDSLSKQMNNKVE